MTDSSTQLPKAAELFMNADWRYHFGACAALLGNPNADRSTDIYGGMRGYLGYCQTLAQAKELAAQPENKPLALSLGGWEKRTWDAMQQRETANPMLFLALFHTEEILDFAAECEEEGRPLTVQAIHDGINTAI